MKMKWGPVGWCREYRMEGTWGGGDVRLEV